MFAVASMGAGGRGRLQWRVLRCLACTCLGSTLILMGSLLSLGVSSVPQVAGGDLHCCPKHFVRGWRRHQLGLPSLVAKGLDDRSQESGIAPRGMVFGSFALIVVVLVLMALLCRLRLVIVVLLVFVRVGAVDDVDDWSSNALGQSYWRLSKARSREGCGCPVRVELVGVALVMDGRQGALRLVQLAEELTALVLRVRAVQDGGNDLGKACGTCGSVYIRRSCAASRLV